MNDFKIVIDSNSDLPEDYIKKNDLSCIYMGFTIDGIDYMPKTNTDLAPQEFYEMLKNGKTSKTSMISVETFSVRFREILDTKKDILYIAFSSALSGTYASAVVAKEDVLQDYPGSNIIVIDSCAASLGLGLLINYAIYLKDQGKTLGEIAKDIEKNKLNFCHYFTVDDLNHLYRGGRVSKSSAMIGTLLGIKPVMFVNDEGKLLPISKVRGRRQSLNALVEKVESKIILEKNKIIFISHGDCLEDARYVADKIKEKFGINNFLINFVGSSIGTHSGPGTVAVFFVGTDRNEKIM